MNYWLPNDVYDKIKWIVTVLLPAATAAYVTFAAIWGWPLADQVKASLVAVYSFLCAIMGISSYTAKPQEWDE